jgi:hypothetical protein
MDVECLPPGLSDHSPCLIQFSFPLPPRTKPFRFINTWTSRPDYKRLVSNAWNLLVEGCAIRLVSNAWNLLVEGCAMYAVVQKLKALKSSLKLWNKTCFGDVSHRVVESRDLLVSAQANLSGQPLDPHLILEEQKAKKAYLAAIADENSSLKQRSKTY